MRFSAIDFDQANIRPVVGDDVNAATFSAQVGPGAFVIGTIPGYGTKFAFVTGIQFITDEALVSRIHDLVHAKFSGEVRF